jgi:hypothetical protein
MARDITSIDYIDDDKGYDELNKLLEENTSSRRRVLIKEMIQSSDKFIEEINKKTKRKDALMKTQIEYILKKSKTNIFSEEELNDMSYEEVKELHDTTVIESKSFFRKFFEFVFGL